MPRVYAHLLAALLVVAALAGSLAADPPAALYYFTESYRGQDLILPALQAKGYAVTQPGSWAEFRQALAGGEYALAIAIENSNGGLDDPVSTASALSDHLAAGRAAWLVDSKGQGSLPAVFQAGYTGGQNVVSVGIFDPELAAGVETPLSLTNPGSYVALSWGLTASSGAVATATFGDGSAAVVLGNDGRSAMIGFAADSLTGQDGQRFYENLVGITVPAPPAITIRQFFCAAAVGSRVTVTVIATDANRNLVAVSLAWGDGAAPDSFAFGPSGRETAILPHTYAARGLYRIAASATDALGATTSRDAACLMAVYGPADSAKGSGSLASPAGAFKEDASVAGTATFSVRAKYAKGASKPTGVFSFNLPSAKLKFKSSSIEWLVLSGPTKAALKGSGTNYKEGGYEFLVSIVDGGTKGGGGDKIRVKIVKKDSGATVYDNQLGGDLADEAPPTAAVGSGNIILTRGT